MKNARREEGAGVSLKKPAIWEGTIRLRVASGRLGGIVPSEAA
jgi:hypothetical protein